MPQIVYRGDGEVQIGPHRLIKDQPQEISRELFDELHRIAEVMQERGLELIIEPRPKRRPT